MNKMRELIDWLNARTAEYDAGIPTVQDSAWDQKYFELQELEKKTSIVYPDSPTHSISYKVVNELKKVEHNHPLLSLAKTKSIQDLEDFIGDKHYLVMLKVDGLTVSVRYLNGELVSAETRGNGEIGEDILHNARVIKNLPQKIDFKGELIVDGEAIITYKDFELFKEDYANPRNLVAGSVRLLDAKEAAKRNINFIAWDCFKGLDNFDWLSQKLDQLDKLGFTTVPRICDDDTLHFMNTEDMINNVVAQAKSRSIPYDGAVIKYDNCQEYYSMGRTEHHFSGGIGYKFSDDEYETRLLDIVYDVSRTGQLTPVALFEDVDTGSSVCNKASLHNLSIMNKLSGGFQRRGDIVTMIKSNEIIPQIICWKHTEGYSENTYISIPEVCPICGGATEIREDGIAKILYCANLSCPGKLANILDHYCGKSGLDIRGLSLKTLEKLIDWDWVNSIKDIYELKNHRAEWVKKSGFGPTSIDKILAAIEGSRKFDLQKFIVAIGIPEIGRSASKDLAKKYKTWLDFRKATYKELSNIPNFGDIMADNILKFNYDEADYIYNNYMIDGIISEYDKVLVLPAKDGKDVKVVIENKVLSEEEGLKEVLQLAELISSVKASNSNVKDKSFVITGTLSRRRDDIIADIEAAGGAVKSSISKKTDYLVCNSDSGSSKSKRAKELNIPIITEEELYRMIKD